MDRESQSLLTFAFFRLCFGLSETGLPQSRFRKMHARINMNHASSE